MARLFSKKGQPPIEVVDSDTLLALAGSGLLAALLVAAGAE